MNVPEPILTGWLKKKHPKINLLKSYSAAELTHLVTHLHFVMFNSILKNNLANAGDVFTV